MKHLITALLLLSGFFAQAQTITNPYQVATITAMKNYYGSSKEMHVAETNAKYIICSPCTANEITVFVGTDGRKWKVVSDTAKLNKSDTINLSNRINGKLNTYDTAALSNRINLKLNRSDTATLSNRINAKANQVALVDSTTKIRDAFFSDEYPHTISVGLGTEASPYTNADNTAGIQTIINSKTVARLGSKRYNVTTPILIRNTMGDTKTAEILGTFAPIMYPNAEGEPVTGTRIKGFTTQAVRMGTLDFVNEPRPGRPRIKDVAFWGSNKTPVLDGNWNNTAILIDGAVDQPQFESLHISNCAFGFVGTGVWDAGTVRNVNIIGNGYPIWIDGTARAGLYCAFDDITIADNRGGVVIGTGLNGNSVGVRISNSVFAHNGNVNMFPGVIPNCHLYLMGSNSIITNNYFTNAGYYNLNGSRIAADGIVIEGDHNQLIGNIVAGQNQAGSCGIRVKSGANGNIINCTYRMVNGFFPTNTTDVIIEAGATNTVLFVYPGMTYTDNGTGTIIIEGSTASYVHVNLSTTNESISSNTSAVVAFNTTVTDTETGWNNSSKEYTVASGGDYLISSQVTYNNAQTLAGKQYQCNIYVNGAPKRVSISQASVSGEYFTSAVSDVLRLNSGDKITIVTFHNSGTTQQILADPTVTFLTVKKIK